MARSSMGKFTKKQSLYFNDHQQGVNYKELTWKSNQSVVLDVEVPINQIPASSLQLCIWSTVPNEINHDPEDGGFSPCRKFTGIKQKTTIVPDKLKALKTTTNI